MRIWWSGGKTEIRLKIFQYEMPHARMHEIHNSRQFFFLQYGQPSASWQVRWGRGNFRSRKIERLDDVNRAGARRNPFFFLLHFYSLVSYSRLSLSQRLRVSKFQCNAEASFSFSISLVSHHISVTVHHLITSCFRLQ